MKYFSLSLPTYGDINPPGNVPTGSFSAGDPTGNTILNSGLQIAFALAIVSVLIMIAWGGIQWVTSEGDKEKIANARKRIMYSIFGLVLILLSVLIINTILFFFGQPQFGVPYANPCNVPNQPC